jgi:hypothetical protein
VPGHLLLTNCVEDETTRPAIERALTEDSLAIPGMTAEGERYVRDLYDHLIRLNDVMKQLTISMERAVVRAAGPPSRLAGGGGLTCVSWQNRHPFPLSRSRYWSRSPRTRSS